ncbi:putative transcription factor HMS1 [Pseudozyma hubeiensis]|nr:putative transcription factor HMS1 [Pseudozyma hubeiensis]
MFPTPVNDGGSSVSSLHHQQQQQKEQYQQQAQNLHHTEPLDTHLMHLHQQQAQLEAMRILQQQQHILPSIVAPKDEQISVLHNPPSGPWSSEDYDSMMRSILDATLPSDHFTDLEAPASLASFSHSYAGSYVSGSSDSGASPHSINDLVYGAANFPTPPDSDVGSSARNFSFSLTPHNAAAISPDGSFDLSNASYAQSHSGSDTTSPYAQQFNLGASTSTSPFGLQPAPLPQASLPMHGVASTSQPWDAHFLAPAGAGLHPSPAPQAPFQASAESASSTEPSASSTANGTSRKRRAADAKAESKKAPAPAAPKPEPVDDSRKTKKAKATVDTKTASASNIVPMSQLSSKLPHMEVGSNATALAAIERLKAKRLQESQAQAAAKAARESETAHGASESSGVIASTDRAQLDPATRQQKKVAHNAIERRYRNNINDRIAALRRAVPALREIRPRKTPSGRRSRKAQQEEDLVDGVPAATKLNKATILGKATDYIKYLKSRELRLTSEVAGLRELVRSLEGGEELLELWEGEMDKVVAEQEALAAAAAAKEEEDEADDDDVDIDDAEEDEDDEEAEAAESSYASASSSSPPSARSRTGSKAGRGRRSGIGGAISSVASSRYMLATFLGISFIGSGAEFAMDATASDASQAVSRPAAGKVMVGASRQLLKRSATYLAPDTSLAQDLHAFDAVPTHALAFELLRVVSFAFCFLFLVWPLFSRLFASRSASSSQRISDADGEQDEDDVGASRKLRLALTKGEIDVAAFDTAVRDRVAAPTSAVLAFPSVVMATSRLALSRASRVRRVLPAQALSDEDAAALGRLLEVETLCEAKSQSSWLLRLHTALRLANSNLGGNVAATRDPVLASPRIKATLALSLARLGEGMDFVQDLADHLWTDARSSLRDAAFVRVSSNEAEAPSPSASDRDESLVQSEDASWLSSVLSLDLDSALDLLSSASSSADASNCDYSAVLAIADVYYCARLTAVWNRLLTSLVDASCPSAAEAPSSSLVTDFVSLQAKQRLDLDVVRDAEQRKDLHAEITSLARTAPPTARAWQMAQVTLATWSALLGNLALARHVASILREHPFSVDGPVKLASVSTLHSFVAVDASLESASAAARDELDAKANLCLGWMRFLRIFADARTNTEDLHAAALHVRKLVAAVTMPGASVSADVSDADLESSLDLVTDLCTALGRRLNRLPATSNGSAVKILLDTSDDDRDSGIEV